MLSPSETKASRLNRWFKRTALVLSLGIATTVAIASIGPDAEVWLYRKWTGTTGYPGSVAGVIETGDEPWYLSTRWERWTATRYRRAYMYVPGSEPTPVLPDDPRAYLESLAARRYGRFISKTFTPGPGAVYASWEAEERGFPFHCVWGWHADAQFDNPAGKPRASGMILPQWSGLVGNVLVWSLAWTAALLMLMPLQKLRRSHRRRVRRERGLCERCGYPVAPGRPCPECGSSATPIPNS